MRCFEKKDVVKKIIFTDLKENNSVNEFYNIQANTMKKKILSLFNKAAELGQVSDPGVPFSGTPGSDTCPKLIEG